MDVLVEFPIGSTSVYCAVLYIRCRVPEDFRRLVDVYGVLVFNATFNNISVISWRSVVLVGEAGVPRETNDLPQVIDKLYHIKSRCFEKRVMHTHLYTNVGS